MHLYEWLNVVVSALLPLLVGLLTKASWNGNLKAVLLLLLSAISAGITSLITSLITAGTLDNWTTILEQTAINWLVAVAVHFHVWKPIGVAAEVAQIGVTDTTPDPGHKAAA